MEIGHWITIGIFVATNLIGVAGFVLSTRVDVGKLKDSMKEMQIELEKLGNILVTLADFKGEMNLIQERQLAQGRRLDESVTELNKSKDRIWARLEKLEEQHRS